MTGYTKGPWTIDPCWDILGNTNDGNGLVCAVTHDAVPREEAEANARLISAAPDMYEALKAIRELSGLDHWISGASAAVMSRMADIHQHSDAALAKAEGKA